MILGRKMSLVFHLLFANQMFDLGLLYSGLKGLAFAALTLEQGIRNLTCSTKKRIQSASMYWDGLNTTRIIKINAATTSGKHIQVCLQIMSLYVNCKES